MSYSGGRREGLRFFLATIVKGLDRIRFRVKINAYRWHVGRSIGQIAKLLLNTHVGCGRESEKQRLGFLRKIQGAHQRSAKPSHSQA